MSDRSERGRHGGWVTVPGVGLVEVPELVAAHRENDQLRAESLASSLGNIVRKDLSADDVLSMRRGAFTAWALAKKLRGRR